MRKPYLLAVALAGLIALAPLYWRPTDPRVLPASAVNAAETYSNILPEDYVGSAACPQCHAREHALWSQHPHSRMNALPGPDTNRGDFDDCVLRLPHATVTFTRRAGAYLMLIEQANKLVRSYEVTKVVGS